MQAQSLLTGEGRGETSSGVKVGGKYIRFQRASPQAAHPCPGSGAQGGASCSLAWDKDWGQFGGPWWLRWGWHEDPRWANDDVPEALHGLQPVAPRFTTSLWRPTHRGRSTLTLTSPCLHGVRAGREREGRVRSGALAWSP